MRFVTVTANVALDTTYLLDGFEREVVNRVGPVVAAPVGKGNNVASVLAPLGGALVATGFASGWTGRRIEEGLRRDGGEPVFVPVPGESRTRLTPVEKDVAVVSEVRDPGELVAAAAAERLPEHVGGSTPGGRRGRWSGGCALPAPRWGWSSSSHRTDATPTRRRSPRS